MNYVPYSTHNPGATGSTMLRELLGGTVGRSAPTSLFGDLLASLPERGDRRSPVPLSRGKLPPSSARSRAIADRLAGYGKRGRGTRDVASGALTAINWLLQGGNPPPLADTMVGGGWYLNGECGVSLPNPVTWRVGTLSSSQYCVNLLNPPDRGAWPKTSDLPAGATSFHRAWRNFGPSWNQQGKYKEDWRRSVADRGRSWEVKRGIGVRPSPGINWLSDPASQGEAQARKRLNIPVPDPRLMEAVIVITDRTIEVRPNPQSRGPGMNGRNRYRDPTKEKKGLYRGAPAVLWWGFQVLENLGDVNDFAAILLEALGLNPKGSLLERLERLRGADWSLFDWEAFRDGFAKWYAQEVFYGQVLGRADRKIADNIGYEVYFGIGNATRFGQGDAAGAILDWLTG